MDQRSEAVETERPFMLGIRWMSFGGRSGWFHTWSDGTILPCLTGFDGSDDEGDEGDDDTDKDDDDEGDDDDTEEEDDSEEDKGKGSKTDPKSKRIKELSDEAASWRVKARNAREARDAATEEVTQLKAKIAKLEKDGTGDDQLKARITELEGELKTEKERADKAVKTSRESAVARQVEQVCDDLDIEDDPEYVRFLLEKKNMLDVDEDGDVVDLKSNIRLLKKRKQLKVRSADEGDDSGDDEDATSGAPRKSSSKSFAGKKKSGQGLDEASLRKKYPALAR